jgi:uncharacterized lipoprotein YajG
MKIINAKKLMPALLAALFIFASCQNPNDQTATEDEIEYPRKGPRGTTINNKRN